MRDFYAENGDILGSGGTDYAIIPLGDRLHEAADGTTVTTVGSGAGDGLTLTYGGGIPSTWDKATYFLRNQQRIPVLEGNATDQFLFGVDADFWSAISGGVDAAFSLILIATLVTETDFRHIFSKDGNASDQERALTTVDSEIRVVLLDDSAGVSASADSNPLLVGRPYHVVQTYDGRGGADAVDGVIIYLNSIEATKSRTNNASYVDMENLGARPAVFSRTNGTGTTAQALSNTRLDGGPFGPAMTRQELTAVQVQNLYDIWVAGRKAQRSRLLAGVI